ncbi:hypothetical protein DFJ73DRAFT_630110 [Zopfochytrium polystomum]|nr:hypothetical protein DFJ73DRAFT_630110 [Zopfochytrium polystomum]
MHFLYRLQHKAGNVSKEALNATTAILSINPDFYSMWNYRRTIISAEWSTMSSEDRKALANGELKLTQELVRTHPKSYWLWNHRQWTLDHMDDPDWMRELKLCQMMLDLDARNFHGWDYRRYVVNKAGLGSSRSEFDYTTSKIEQSFSNYSAWHYRSKLIPRVMKAAEEREGQVTKGKVTDFHLVRNAFFTDPSDQSAWFYHRWLLGERKQEWNTALQPDDVWRSELKHVEELVEIEPDSKCEGASVLCTFFFLIC